VKHFLSLYSISGALALTLLTGCSGSSEGPGAAEDRLSPRSAAKTLESPPKLRHEYSRGAMGVHVRVLISTENATQADIAAQAAFATIHALEGAISSYNPRSELRQLEAKVVPGEWIPVSQEFSDALRVSLTMTTETSGAYDPTLGALSRLWRSAREQGIPPEPESVERARTAIGFHWVEFDVNRQRVRFRHPGVRLDFGGIGKGLAADAALATLKKHNCPRALVDVGGDLAIGAPPLERAGWEVAVSWRSSDEGSHRQGKTDQGTEPLELSHCGIATSGDQEQHLLVSESRLSHILDPRTGTPLVGAAAVTVLAPNASRADAWATALSVAPEQRARLEEQPGTRVWFSTD